MFEVIISHVQSGRVRRAYFATRDEAQRHLAREEERVLCPKRGRPGSLRDYRMEVVHREPAVVRPLPAPAAGGAAA